MGRQSVSYAASALPAGLVGKGAYDSRLNVYALGNTLKRTLAKINAAAVSASGLHIAVIGDSIDAAALVQPSTQAYAVLLREILKTRRGAADGGTGIVVATTGAGAPLDSRMATTGTFTFQTGNGVSFSYASLAAAQTLTFTADRAGTRVHVLYLDNQGAFSVKVDGAFPAAGNVSGGAYNAATGVVTPGGTQAWKLLTIANQTNAAHVVLITQSSASATIGGVGVSQTNGVRVSNLAMSGATSINWIVNAAVNPYYGFSYYLTTIPAPDLVLVSGAVALADDTTAVSVANTQANLTGTIQTAQGLGAEVLVVGVDAAPATNFPNAGSTARRQAVINAADATGVPVLEMFDRWGSNAAAVAAGLLPAGDPHPTATGHQDYAYALAAILAP